MVGRLKVMRFVQWCNTLTTAGAVRSVYVRVGRECEFVLLNATLVYRDAFHTAAVVALVKAIALLLGAVFTTVRCGVLVRAVVLMHIVARYIGKHPHTVFGAHIAAVVCVVVATSSYEE